MHKAQWKSLSDMADLLDKHDHLKHVLFNKLGHIMQTVVLTQRKSQEKVVIGIAIYSIIQWHHIFAVSKYS